MPKIAEICWGSNNTRIPIISLSKRSYWSAAMTIAVRNFPFHFKPVNKGSYCKHHTCSTYKRSFTIANTTNHQSNYNQRQSITPNKFQHFQQNIQYILNFVNCCHVFKNFFRIRYIIAQILLKTHEFRRTKHRFFKYIGQNNNTIRTV